MYFADKCLSSQVLLFYHAENYVPSFYAAVPAPEKRQRLTGCRYRKWLFLNQNFPAAGLTALYAE